MRPRILKGGLSGGTYASIANLIKEAVAHSQTRKDLLNPFLLCPPNHGFSAKQKRVFLPVYDASFSQWSAPFIMAITNEALVRRSHALNEDVFQADFIYNEAWMFGRGLKGALKAMFMASGLGLFMTGLVLPPTRYLLQKLVLPAPGHGPSFDERAAGHHESWLHGQTANGHALKVKVTGEGDPAYLSTSRMLGQAVLSLAKDHVDETGEKTTPGGFWTTASLLGHAYLERLQQYAEMKFVLME